MKQNRKIFNFESVIDKKLTLEREGIDVDISGWSNKYIWASCRFCGEPHRIKGSNFKTSGSACHEQCRNKEMSIAGSPFSDPEVKEKADKTNLEKYGTVCTSKNDEIRAKMAAAKKDQSFQARLKKTINERYGVDYIFQSEDVKKKIKKSMISRHGVEVPLQSPSIREKQQNTCLEKHGVKFALQNETIKKAVQDTCKSKYSVANVMQDDAIKTKAQSTFKETVVIDAKEQYRMVNLIRDGVIWPDMLANLTLDDICKKHNLDYRSFAAALMRPEFKEQYQQTYSFPTQQKQTEVFKFITEDLKLSAVRNCRKTLDSGFELDIWVPGKNFAIEFNGNYWHSEAVLGPYAQRKHVDKTDECTKKGIRLFHLFEHIWDSKKDQVKGFLRSALGENTQTIAARKCSIGYDCGTTLCENHHIQGVSNGSVKTIDLIYLGEVVGSIILGKHHRQNYEGNPIVLTRMIFKSGITVQGGASKLFKYAVEWARAAGHDRIISWSDSALTPGNIYNQLRFTLDKILKHSYFYWDVANKKYHSKQSQRKATVACPPELKEWEWAKQRGLYRVWDCGKKRWVFFL